MKEFKFVSVLFLLGLVLWGTAGDILSQPGSIAKKPSVSGAALASLQDQKYRVDSLGQIVLTIAPDQVLGLPLIPPAQAVLLDTSGVQLTSFDLSARPIRLSPDTGFLVPDSLSDTTLFSAGIVNLVPAGIVYHGRTGVVRIRAGIDTLLSNGVDVTFNGLDILDYFVENGGPIQTVYSNLLTTIKVVVRNGGSLTPVSQPWVKSFFRSGGGSVKSFLPALSNGAVDTVTIDLPTDNLAAGLDTLILLSQSVFDVGGALYTALDSVLIPVSVQTPASLQFVDGSLAPDSVYAGEPFNISFALNTAGFAGPVDSSFVTVRLFRDTTQAAVATLYQAQPTPTSFISDTMIYSGLIASLDTALGLSGWYWLRLDHHLVSQGTVYATNTRYPDSLFVASPAVVSYVAGALTPPGVTAGATTAFSFQFQLNAPNLILLDSSASRLTITGQTFTSIIGLTPASLQLNTGINNLQSDSVLIPAFAAGDSLSFSLTLQYRQPGVVNSAHFTSDFAGEHVHVHEQPRVRIIDVSTIAPNSPKVNTNQRFRISCQVENLSSVRVDSLMLRLSSDGLSTFLPDLFIDSLLALDTVTLYFDINAAPDTNAAELFQVEVISSLVAVEPPLDNSASATIQTPARLKLTRTPSSDSLFVEPSASFDLTFTLTNSGSADITPGWFRLSSGGVDVGIPDPLRDSIVPGLPVVVTITMPDSETAFDLTFSLDSLPVDRNSTLFAPVSDTSLVTSITVTPLEGQLVVQSSSESSGLIVSGHVLELLTLNFSNTETFGSSLLSIDSLTVVFMNSVGGELNTASVVDTSSVALFDDAGRRIAGGQVNGSLVRFSFVDFTLSGGEARSLHLRAQTRQDLTSTFQVGLSSNQVYAIYLAGPQAGKTAVVTAQSPDGGPLNQSYTPVHGLNADQSFIIRDNPFSPYDGPAEMQFFLSVTSSVEFRIFNLVGEEVYSRFFGAGELQPGQLNALYWDGRTDEGRVVVNGVYIAQVKVNATGDRGKLKIAVLK